MNKLIFVVAITSMLKFSIANDGNFPTATCNLEVVTYNDFHERETLINKRGIKIFLGTLQNDKIDAVYGSKTFIDENTKVEYSLIFSSVLYQQSQEVLKSQVQLTIDNSENDQIINSNSNAISVGVSLVTRTDKYVFDCGIDNLAHARSF